MMLVFSPDPHTAIVLRSIFYVLLAMVGAAFGYASRAYGTDSKVVFTWRQLVVETGSAGFVGFLVLMLCMWMNFGEPATALTVGLMGWLGAPASIVILEKVLYKKLGISNDVDPTA